MKIGLYFGSFNPVHTAHLIIANTIAHSPYVDEVWFIPSPQNPLKQSETLLNENERKLLIELAIKGENKLKCNPVEFLLPRPSYTINTLIYLKHEQREFDFTVIMGSDSFQNIHQWKDYERLLSEYTILIYRRHGFELNTRTGENITALDAPLLDISATNIRKMIKKGDSIRYFVPDIVKEAIEKNGYYL